MRKVRAVVASLLAGTLAAQFGLASLGQLCVIPQQDPAMVSLVQRAHAVVGTGRSMSAFVAVTRSAGDSMPMPGAPCDRSGTPAQCMAMVACACSVVAAAPVPAPNRLSVPSRVIVASVTTVPAPTFPPELPPPRA